MKTVCGGIDKQRPKGARWNDNSIILYPPPHVFGDTARLPEKIL